MKSAISSSRLQGGPGKWRGQYGGYNAKREGEETGGFGEAGTGLY